MLDESKAAAAHVTVRNSLLHTTNFQSWLCSSLVLVSEWWNINWTCVSWRSFILSSRFLLLSLGHACWKLACTNSFSNTTCSGRSLWLVFRVSGACPNPCPIMSIYTFPYGFLPLTIVALGPRKGTPMAWLESHAVETIVPCGSYRWNQPFLC